MTAAMTCTSINNTCSIPQLLSSLPPFLPLSSSMGPGGYVLFATAIGVVARHRRSRSLYGVYYCLNVMGITLSLLAAIWPNLLATSNQGICVIGNMECDYVRDDLHQCPYTTTTKTFSGISPSPQMMAVTSFLGGGRRTSILREMSATTSTSTTTPKRLRTQGMMMRMLEGEQDDSQCCYLDDFKISCG